MAAMIAEDIIERIREQTDIVSLVSDYVSLKHSGDNHLGLCPFHNEKTPSFNVNSSRQIFHCFGCGVGGNVFSFLMRIEGVSFPESVRRLGERLGIEVEEEQASPHQQQRQRERERQQQLFARAAEFYHQLLLKSPQAASARAYLRQRGFDGEIARQFQLGFAPESWDSLTGFLQEQGLDTALARELGLIREGREGRGDYDLFRRRLLFPIADLQGHPVAFGGRVLDDSLPKYINSPESPLYHKGRTLYGLYQAKTAIRRERQVIVVEGYFDLLALVQAGIEGVVAPCGTALTPEHAQLLKRFAERVVLLFDQDTAGQKACFRALPELLREGLQVMTLTLPTGDDPDSFIQREGAEAFRTRLDQAGSAVEAFMAARLVADAAPEQRARAIEEVLELLRQVPGEIERNLYLRGLAQRSGLGMELLAEQLRRAPAATRPTVAPKAPASRSPAPLPVVQPVLGEEKAQRWLLALMVNHATVARDVALAGVDSLFVDDAAQAVARQLCQAHEQGRDPGAWLLDRCHDERCPALLSDILMAREPFAGDEIEKLFGDCRQAVLRGQLKHRRVQLHAQMREAEAEGDTDRQTACLQELTRINRQLKNRNG